MAKCPKCGATQDWLKLLRVDRTALLSCRHCGSILALDSQRSLILLAGLIALLALPQSRLLPFDWGLPWFIGVVIVYLPFYLAYTKLNLVSEGDLKISPGQRQAFERYAVRRRRYHVVGRILFWAGLIVFFAGAAITSSTTSELVTVVGLVALTAGMLVMAVTRCPYCNKLTLRNPFDHGGRCIHCHRDIDVPDA